MSTTTIFGTLLILISKLFELQGTTSFLVSKVEIGPDTTFVEGPLKSNGMIDYEAALNRLSSQGVTPDNNSVVLLDRAFGSRDIDLPTKLRPRFCNDLGVQEPQIRLNFFVDHKDFAKHLIENGLLRAGREQDFFKEIEAAEGEPWMRDEYPRVAAWIDRNDEVLQLVEQASLRSRFRPPIIVTDSLMNAPIPIVRNCRETEHLLSTRCMLRIAEGNYDGAAQDVLTCERLAVLIGQSPFSVCSLTACSLDSVAVSNLVYLLAQPLTIDQIETIESSFLALPAVLDIATPVDRGDRFVVLESTEQLWRRYASIGWWKDTRISWIPERRQSAQN